MSGRPHHNYWETGRFQFSRRKYGRLTALCLICNRELRNTAKSRMIQHRKKCRLTDESIPKPKYTRRQAKIQRDKKLKLRNEENRKMVEINDEDDDYELVQVVVGDNSEDVYITEGNELKEEVDHTEWHLKIKDKVVDGHIMKIEAIPSTSGATMPMRTKLPKTVREDLHLAFAKFFIGSNIPFTALKSNYLKQFTMKLNPSYRPPYLRELTTTYLDKICESQPVQMTSEKQNATLLLSGWKNFTETSKCIVACLHLVAENEPEETRVFLNIWDIEIDFNTNKDTTELSIVEEARELTKKLYNTDIYAIISDNSQMDVSSLDTPLWNVLCRSYLAGCLAEDIVDQNDVKTLTEILQALLKDDIEDHIQTSGGIRIVLPSKNRWCSYRDSFQCFIKNNSIVRDLLDKKVISLDPTIRNGILNDDLLRKSENYFKVLKPLCKLIYLSQKRKTTLAEITEEWIYMSFPAEYQTHLETRRAEALSPLALTANFLHPAYRGNNLTKNQMGIVESFLLETLDSSGLDQVVLFKRNRGIFKTLQDITSTGTFWIIAARYCPELASLAKKILCIPLSVSYMDRIFTNWSTTHLDTRHLMGMELYRKLTKAHFLLNLEGSNESNV